MNINELTLFQLNALNHFESVRALTETGLCKLLKCEKAVAAHAVRVLTSVGALKKYGQWEYAITEEGRMQLVAKGIITAKAKPDPKPRKARTVSDSVRDMTASETAALTGELNKPADPPVVEVGADQVIEAGVISIDVQVDGLVNDPKGDAPVCDESPQDGRQYNFAELVQRGLTRLTKQLNFQPIAIEDKRLKISTLTSLADTLDGFDVSLAAMLRKIATDLNKLNEANNG